VPLLRLRLPAQRDVLEARRDQRSRPEVHPPGRRNSTSRRRSHHRPGSLGSRPASWLAYGIVGGVDVLDRWTRIDDHTLRAVSQLTNERESNLSNLQ